MENGNIDWLNHVHSRVNHVHNRDYERKLYGILKKLQKTYRFYMLEKSFSRLFDILMGIGISAEEYLGYTLSFFVDFQDFLVKEYNIPNGPTDHWTKFILQGRTEAEAFDYFFELLDQFIENRMPAEKPKEFADCCEEKLYDILREIKDHPALYMETPSRSK